MGFWGIQFGYALQNANASRILQTFGANIEQLSWFWLTAPLTGMIIQPIIGHYSDQTWTRLGRRKPFFLVLLLMWLWNPLEHWLPICYQKNKVHLAFQYKVS